MGKLFVIEGLDGSGKTTQLNLLDKNIKKMGYSTRQIKLPNYEDPSSELVKMYLQGRFGTRPQDVNIFAASSFFAVDRYVSYNCYWKEDYSQGKLILADRYTTSNAYHQMIKVPKNSWNDYLEWLEDYEYNKLGIPRPDTVIYLDVPVEVSQNLLTERYKGDEIKKDIHEKNVSYLLECRQAALFACEKLKWHRIDCVQGQGIKTIQAIAQEVFSIILKELNIDAGI